ncbi:MAG TPA: hypothetical protein VGL99_02865 [Chloroflexota bacterium]
MASGNARHGTRLATSHTPNVARVRIWEAPRSGEDGSQVRPARPGTCGRAWQVRAGGAGCGVSSDNLG